MNIIGDNEVYCHHCGNYSATLSPAHHVQAGSVLFGRYLVGKAIGEGGFGITYIGLDLSQNVKIAIKEYYPTNLANRNSDVSQNIYYPFDSEGRENYESGLKRFLLEARILSQFVNDDGVVTVKAYFESNKTAYIVMEYVDGITLKKLMQLKGRIAPDHVFGLLKPIMKSLGNIHARNLIHRDISPDNIMLVNNRAKLIDFGAARNISANASKSLSIMLKHGYAPEEQYRSRGKQGPWTDIYALCATMYHCITGKKPDEATQRLVKDELVKPSNLGVQIDKNLESVLMKGLQVYQKDRYQNIDEMMRDIEKKIYTVSPTELIFDESDCPNQIISSTFKDISNKKITPQNVWSVMNDDNL